jgi:hypothetical protein
MGRAGHARVATRSWSSLVGQLLDHYAAVADGRRERAA